MLRINNDLIDNRGGELIAYGTAYNTTSNTTILASGASLAFSSPLIPNKDYSIKNYIDGIIEFTGGTFRIHTKGIVGLVKATVTFCGYTDAGCVGWWWQGNENALPTGVTMPENLSGSITSGPATNSYGGATKTFQYIVDTDNNVSFYVNPKANAYQGSIYPARGGTKCVLQVEVYAKKV